MLLPVAFCVYYSIQLLNIRHFQVRSNRVLAFFFLPFIFLQLFSYTADLSEVGTTTGSISERIAHVMLFMFASVAFLWGPTMYVYLKSLGKLEGVSFTWRKDLRHFLLSIITLAINIPLAIVILVLGKESSVYELAAQITTIITLGGILVVWPLQNVVYIILSYRMYRRHRRTFVEFFSYEEGINLRWMRNTITCYTIFVLLVALTAGVEYGTELDLPEGYFNSLVLLFVIYVGYNGTRQIDVYYGLLTEQQRKDALQQPIQKKVKSIPLAPVKPVLNGSNGHAKEAELPPAAPVETTPAEPQTTKAEEPVEKYSGSSLKDADRVEAIKNQLLEFMESERPYLNVQLTIFDIARELDINNKYISQVINQDLGINFMSFINGYRVEAAKELLLDDSKSNYTIEGLAEMAGFKSKSTFNTAFKKMTGKTPSQYRKEQLAMA